MVSNKKRLYWTLQLIGWLSYASLQILFSMIASQGASWRRIIFFIVEALICLLITHFFRHVIIRWKWLTLSITQAIPRILLSVAVLGLVTYLLRIPFSLLFNVGGVRAGELSATQILGFSAFYMFLMFLWMLFYFIYHYIERYNRSLKYEAYMMQSELNNLKSQLNPHFIFNSLNSIRALVDENPGKSKQAINQLSNILRNSLTFDKKGLTKFEDEMKVVRDYLGLESIRFEERLKTEFDIHPESNSFLVPPFMIQTLVENGIKHGISKLTQGGVVQLKTKVEHGRLRILIRNSGHMVNGAKRGKSGVGIKNTIQRLRILYGEEAAFKITNESNNFVLTEIVIPQTNNKYESAHNR